MPLKKMNPLLAKVIRLTYEHIEAYQTFDIPIPEDEPVEDAETEYDEANALTQKKALITCFL